MRVAASYTCPVLPPDGIPLKEMHITLEAFDVTIDGVSVRVKPEVDETSYEEIDFIDEEGRAPYSKRPYLALTDLSAHIEQDTDAVDWESFDRRRFDEPARAALEQTSQQLRAMASWTEVNTRLRWLEVKYRQPNGEPLPWKTPLYVSFEGIGDLLEEHHWLDVQAAVESGQRISLPAELLLEARRFLLQRNARFALVSAAVACEVSLRQRIVSALSATRGITPDRAEDLFQEVSNRHLIALLPCFFDVPEGLIDEVREVFNQRNLILHGRQRRQPSQDQARAAISAARKLAELATRARSAGVG